MRQFALEIEIDLSAGETLSAALNGILLEKKTWGVINIHTMIVNKSKLATSQQPAMTATIVFSSPEEDMPKEAVQELKIES